GKGPGGASILELPEGYLQAARISMEAADLIAAKQSVEEALNAIKAVRDQLSENSPLGRELIDRARTDETEARTLLQRIERIQLDAAAAPPDPAQVKSIPKPTGLTEAENFVLQK